MQIGDILTLRPTVWGSGSGRRFIFKIAAARSAGRSNT